MNKGKGGDSFQGKRIEKIDRMRESNLQGSDVKDIISQLEVQNILKSKGA